MSEVTRYGIRIRPNGATEMVPDECGDHVLWEAHKAVVQCHAEEVARLRAERGRCKKHLNEPGPSLYHDCCESERLRELVRELRAEVERLRVAEGEAMLVVETQAAQLTRLQSEKSAAVEVLHAVQHVWDGEVGDALCPSCSELTPGHEPNCALAAALSGGAA